MRRLVPLALALLAAPAVAQSVEDHFHRAAQLYVAGQNAQAEAAATEGLRLDPTDAKLQALLEEIRKQNPQNGGAQQQGQDADPQQGENDAAQPEGRQGPQQPGEGGQPQEEAGQERAEPQPGQQGQPDEGELQPPEDADQEARRDETGQPGQQQPEDARGGSGVAAPFEVAPGEMSRAEAERILRAMEADELELLRDVQRRRARPRFVERDW